MKQKVSLQLSDLLPPQNIEVSVDVSSKTELLEHLAAKASGDLSIDTHRILMLLQKREALGSTAIGRGIALPHSVDVALDARVSCAETEELTQPYLRLARLAQPVSFDALDGDPVDIAIVMLVPTGRTALALRILSAAARLLRSSSFCAKVRAASTGHEVYAALVNEEVFSPPPSGNLGKAP